MQAQRLQYTCMQSWSSGTKQTVTAGERRALPKCCSSHVTSMSASTSPSLQVQERMHVEIKITPLKSPQESLSTAVYERSIQL